MQNNLFIGFVQFTMRFTELKHYFLSNFSMILNFENTISINSGIILVELIQMN